MIGRLGQGLGVGFGFGFGFGFGQVGQAEVNVTATRRRRRRRRNVVATAVVLAIVGGLEMSSLVRLLIALWFGMRGRLVACCLYRGDSGEGKKNALSSSFSQPPSSPDPLTISPATITTSTPPAPQHPATTTTSAPSPGYHPHLSTPHHLPITATTSPPHPTALKLHHRGVGSEDVVVIGEGEVGRGGDVRGRRGENVVT
ncbi:hypothetical protein Droror1_Dr00019789 [Drosera rotundifolia]